MRAFRVSLAVGLFVLALAPRNLAADTGLPTIGATRTAILVWLADELGYIADAGFRVKLFQSGTTASKALAEGEVQLATGSHVAFVSSVLKAPKIEIVSTLSTSRTAKLVGRRDMTGTSIDDLVGKRVGVTRGSFGDYMLDRLLKMQNVSAAEIEHVDLKPSGIVQGLIEGSLAAGLTWEPFVYQAREALGELAVQYPGQEGQYYYFLLIGRADWLALNREHVVHLLTALTRAEGFAREQPEQAKQIIAKAFDMDREFAEYIWPEHSLTVALPQDLVRLLEEAVLWREATSGGSSSAPMPNVLDYIRSSPLRSAAPHAVGVIE